MTIWKGCCDIAVEEATVAMCMTTWNLRDVHHMHMHMHVKEYQFSHRKLCVTPQYTPWTPALDKNMLKHA
jgi:hypothetical protein